MNNKTYDILKYIAQIVLPALGTLYFALSETWGLPYGAEIVGTITAVDAFLGALLKLSSNAYYKQGKDTDGTLMIDPSGDTEKWLFQLDGVSMEDLADKLQIKLKVDGKADLSGEEISELYEGKH